MSQKGRSKSSRKLSDDSVNQPEPKRSNQDVVFQAEGQLEVTTDPSTSRSLTDRRASLSRTSRRDTSSIDDAQLECIVKKVLNCDTNVQKISDAFDKKIQPLLSAINKRLERDEKDITTLDERINEIDTRFREVKSLQRKLDEVSNDIEEIKETAATPRSERFISLEEKVDELDQMARNRNIILMGLRSHEDIVAQSLAIFRNIMGVRIRLPDIDHVIPLTRSNDRSVTFGCKIVFNDVSTKMAVYRARTALKDHNIWITDDLTPNRAHLAYLARQAVRNKKFALTWVFDGKVFAKESIDSLPRRLYRESDIPVDSDELNEEPSTSADTE